MANRNTLHINKLDAFKEFLNSEGIACRPGKGVWQVLQVLTPKHGWQCIFSRADMPEHYTIQDKLYPLVRQFLDNNKIQPIESLSTLCDGCGNKKVYCICDAEQ